ncbi:MAG TPA: universal stress protein, partial [Polyangiaceae bacterium]|nr:universal stress protein [Polyangiaceae bacterium]
MSTSRCAPAQRLNCGIYGSAQALDGDPGNEPGTARILLCMDNMPFERILVATDFSDGSQQALEYALRIAEKFDSELTLVHVW